MLLFFAEKNKAGRILCLKMAASLQTCNQIYKLILEQYLRKLTVTEDSTCFKTCLVYNNLRKEQVVVCLKQRTGPVSGGLAISDSKELKIVCHIVNPSISLP